MDFSGQTRKRKVDQSTRVTLNREELLRAHSQQILQQEQLKQQEKAVRLLQRWYRGRKAAGLVKDQYRTLAAKRLSDLQKLEKVLKDNFVLVLDKAMPDLVKIFVFSYAPSQAEQLCALCRMLMTMFRGLARRVSPFFQDATITSSRSRLIYLLGSLCEFTATTQLKDPGPYEFCTLILNPASWKQSLLTLEQGTINDMCDRILRLASGSKSFFSYLLHSLKVMQTTVKPRDFKTATGRFPVSAKQEWYEYAWTLWGQKCSERSHLDFLWKTLMPVKHALAKLPPELVRCMIRPDNLPHLHVFVWEKLSQTQQMSDHDLALFLSKSPDFVYNLSMLLYFFAMSGAKLDIAVYVKTLLRCFTLLKKHFRVVLKFEDPFQLRGFQIEESEQSLEIEEEPQLGIFDLEEEREETKESEPMDESPGPGLPASLLESYEVLETSNVIKLLTSCCDLIPLCNLYCDLYLTMVHGGRKNVDELLCKLVYNTTFIRQMHCVFLSLLFDVDAVLNRLKDYISLLTLFTGCLSQLLLVIDDNEFHSEEPMENRLSISETSDITVFLNQLGHKLCLSNLNTTFYQQYGAVLFRNVVNVLNQLYDRHCRRAFVQQRDWNLCQMPAEQLVRSLGTHSRFSLILERMPHLYPFETRATIFHYLVLSLKHESYRRMDHFIDVRIRRSNIVEDAIEELRFLSGEDMITAARITFIGPGMVPEMGVDAGGLFKEFLTNFSKVAFDPSSGYFIEADKRALIPNPRYILEHPHHTYVYEVMGMIIGKAILEEVLLQPNFSRIFLNKLLNKPCYFSDLKELDLQYAKSLEMIKHYKGDYEDLGLWFSTSEEVNSRSVSIPLIPGGERIPVTRNNVMRYIKAMTNYKLNLQIQDQCEAFLQGLNKVLPLVNLSIFNQDELQLMISGNTQGFDVNDLRANVEYSGYTESSSAVQNFWKYLAELDDEGRSKFLQFCTGCSRAPLLGFKYLVPKFTIEKGADTSMLPTASTCTNTFRLPPFKNFKVMKEKLDIAICSNAGFGFGAGVWETAKAIHSSEGLRSALVYLEGEIRHFVSSRDCENAVHLTKQLVTLCNSEAASQTKNEAVVTLRRAKTALDYIERQRKEGSGTLFRLQLLTCNNLANVLKDLGDSHRALQYLMNAQEIIESRQVEDSSDNLQCIASTKVNISTVKLELKQYADAIAFAEQCLHLLQMRLALTSSSLATLAQQDSEKYSSMLQSYLSAMFNIGIAEEALGRKDAAVKSYSACVKFGKAYLPCATATITEAETALTELLDSQTERDMTTAPTVSSRPHLATKSAAQLCQTARVPHKPSTPGTSYYSKERLAHVHRLLSRGEKKQFISSSQYFNLQINKNLKLEQDVHHLIPVSHKQLAQTARSRKPSEVDPDKQSLAQLRKRKYKKRAHSRDDESRGSEYVQKRLSALRSEAQPRFRSAGHKRLSESLTVKRSELSEYGKKDVDSRMSDMTTSPTRLQSRLTIGKTKEELEAFMTQLQTDMKSLSPDRPRPPRSPRPTTRSQLANSVLQTRAHSRGLSGTQPPSKLSELLSRSETEAGKRKAIVTFLKAK